MILNGPVPPETHPDDVIAVLGDFPSDSDVTNGRPFTDRNGRELMDAFDLIGLPRNRCRFFNVAACRPNDGDIKKAFAIGKKKGFGLHPLVACAQGRGVQDFKYIIVLGDACKFIKGANYSPDSLRGACEEVTWLDGRTSKVGYTLHPRRVLQDPKWRDTFRNDIAKSIRYFKNKLTWTDPETIIVTSLMDFTLHFPTFLTEKNPEYISYDVETDGLKAMSAKLRCIGFATGDRALTVAVRRIDGSPIFTKKEWEGHVKPTLRAFLKNPPAKLIGHNAGQYDRLNCEEQLGVTPKLDTDTILLSLLADNEMPHGLGYEGSYRTDFTEAWKADNTREDAKTDMALWVYNAKDCAVTHRIRAPLLSQVAARGQTHLIEREHLLQKIGWAMQRIGMRVDQEKVHEHMALEEKKRDTALLTMRENISSSFNPGSLTQLSRLLFVDWNLSPVSYSELTGAPSCDDDTIRTMITKYPLTADQRVILNALRMYRQATKVIGTYLARWLPGPDSHLGADGRIHPSYNRLPATGRYSSSDPNAQNIPSLLRDCFVPEPGHIFIGCDADALEAKAIAEESASPRMLSIFNNLLDLHNETMEHIYGAEVWNLPGAPSGACLHCGAGPGVPCHLPNGTTVAMCGGRTVFRTKKGKGLFKDTRGVTKNVRYAWQYGAWYKKIWEQVVSVEDEHGNLPYAQYTKDMIREVCDGLSSADPEVPIWWDSVEADFKRHGFVADTIWGRRRYFRGDATKNERINHPIQAGGFGIVMEALIELLIGHQPWFATEATSIIDTSAYKPWVTWDFKRRIGMVTQTHDSSMWEVPEDVAEEFGKTLEASMTRRRKTGALLTYTAEKKIGPTWEAV